jgi:hypothetical protein
MLRVHRRDQRAQRSPRNHAAISAGNTLRFATLPYFSNPDAASVICFIAMIPLVVPVPLFYRWCRDKSESP